MKKLILSQQNRQQAVTDVVNVLRTQGVVILPTETVYGLMTACDNDLGRDKIIQIKQRPKEKLFQVLIDSVEEAEAAGAFFDKRAKLLAEKFWPGPMTMVVPTKDGATIGLRMPDYDLVREVIRELGQPLAATSANLSGEPPVKDISDIEDYFVDAFPDLVVDAGERTCNTASTVISLYGDEVTVLREGIITQQQILDILNTVS